MEDERRSYPRMKVNREAQFQIGGLSNSIPCIVEDISMSGMRLCLRKNLFPEVFSSFNLALDDGLVFDAGAHVAWHDESEAGNTYGLSFNRINEPDSDRISQLSLIHI